MKKTFNRHLHFFRPGLNTMLLLDARYLLEKAIKLTDIEKLTYIIEHRIFVTCSNRTCDFTIKYFDVT